MAKSRRRGSHSTGTLVPPASRGKSWAIRWQEDGQRKYAGGYENKQAAEDALEVIRARITAGMHGVIPRPEPTEIAPTIAQAADDWPEIGLAAKGYRDDRNRYDKHVAPKLGDLRIDRVTKATVDELVVHLKAPSDLGPAGIERVLFVLSGFYRWAIRREVVASNPVRDYLASQSVPSATGCGPSTTPTPRPSSGTGPTWSGCSRRCRSRSTSLTLCRRWPV